MKFWKGALERYAQSVARQSGRLLAVLATNDGARMKVDWLLDTIFVAMVDELADRGVPRRVAADMLGCSHRTLQRRYSVASEGLKARGRSVWTTVVEHLRDGPLVREELVGRVKQVPPVIVASVVNDMIESGWIDERDDHLHLATDLGREFSDEELHRHIDVRRRAESNVTPQAIANDIGVSLERVEAAWELSENVMVRAQGDDVWMAMERAYQRAIDLLRESAGNPRESPHSATTWRVRLDDKPQEFQDELLDFINDVAAQIKEKVAPMRTHYETTDESRFWTFTAFQSHDP